MDKKLNISFEVEDNYDRGDFRAFIKFLLSNDQYNIFIISNADDSAEVLKIGNNLGMDIENIIICNFTDDKRQAIIDNKIDIHFDNLQSFIMLVDETTDAWGVLVSAAVNKYYAKSDYLVTFDTILLLIKKENEET